MFQFRPHDTPQQHQSQNGSRGHQHRRTRAKPPAAAPAHQFDTIIRQRVFQTAEEEATAARNSTLHTKERNESSLVSLNQNHSLRTSSLTITSSASFEGDGQASMLTDASTTPLPQSDRDSNRSTSSSSASSILEGLNHRQFSNDGGDEEEEEHERAGYSFSSSEDGLDCPPVYEISCRLYAIEREENRQLQPHMCRLDLQECDDAAFVQEEDADAYFYDSDDPQDIHVNRRFRNGDFALDNYEEGSTLFDSGDSILSRSEAGPHLLDWAPSEAEADTGSVIVCADARASEVQDPLLCRQEDHDQQGVAVRYASKSNTFENENGRRTTQGCRDYSFEERKRSLCHVYNYISHEDNSTCRDVDVRSIDDSSSSHIPENEGVWSSPTGVDGFVSTMRSSASQALQGHWRNSSLPDWLFKMSSSFDFHQDQDEARLQFASGPSSTHDPLPMVPSLYDDREDCSVLLPSQAATPPTHAQRRRMSINRRCASFSGPFDGTAALKAMVIY
jgi:hypothetical protein